jgi:hypothetical protein
LATSRISLPLPPVSLRKLVDPIEPQDDFFAKIAKYDFVLYEGEGGGGKSYVLRWWLVLYLLECFKKHNLRGVQVGMFCEDYPSLEDRQISKMRAEFPRALGSFKQDRTLDFVLRDCYGGGKLALRNLDKPEKYSSAEFAAIAVDELTKNHLKVFNDLRWRLRWPGIARPKFAAATNPGGVGHTWVKKYWITKDLPKELQSKAEQFVTVKARTRDNPHLDPGYHESLLTLPPEMAGRVGHGNWDIYIGQYFPYFSDKIHVIAHAEAMARIREFHQRALSGDWGFDHPHSFHWHAKDETNTVITYRELWDRGIGESEVGRRITAAEAEDSKLAPLKSFVFSWDAGKLSPRSSKKQPRSINQLVSDALGPRIPKPHPCDSSPGVRLIRARLMSQLIGYPGDPERNIPAQPPKWFISERCPKLIAALPEMMRDPEHTEEMLKMDHSDAQIGDDPVDSAGMGLQWMVGSVSKPDAVKLEEQFHAIRQKFVQRQVEAKLGEDWFQKFGGQKAQKRPR